MTWLCDIAGKTGKSLFTDMLEENPQYGCLVLILDSYRSFKYTSAKLISDYIDQKGNLPNALIMDTPRDEESKYLHEIYGVLEEINNGRLYGSFHGKIINRKMARGIPIIVFSNSPPITRSLSKDRWDIKALYRTVDGKDVYVQNAKITSNVLSISNNTLTWRNLVETQQYEKESDLKSDSILFKSTIQLFCNVF